MSELASESVAQRGANAATSATRRSHERACERISKHCAPANAAERAHEEVS